MGFLMSLLGGIADHYARAGGGGGGGWTSSRGPAGAGWYLAQKEHWANDAGRFAPPIVRHRESWPGGPRPGPEKWPGSGA